ncbi:VTT domain-containing protein [Roseateles puraquae]|uniref:DedA family protein n=1 Tax=Roseateles puraquae TaxID=431059 RepID=A0A254MY79_9BURK|nr:VTT domain-containing protein [Roseateles puraquae]MDG0855841.1 hypothetical protein [Roseateles puraquae]OWQ99919.1 hypothetical protein CDO81_25835 [Roseateles puraquae]
MLRRTIENRLLRALSARADRPAFPLVVAGAAAAATLSMSVPFAGLLVAAVLLAPRRWIAIACGASMGAAAGALVLYLVFHHLGWNRFFASYPDIVQSTAWRDATDWLTRYGVGSLLVIAALPLPLTPALIFAAISRLPVGEVILALWMGKLAKYLVYSWATSYFPDRLLQRSQRQLQDMGALLSRIRHQPTLPTKESR